jgi:hypothetical protein
MATTTDPNLMLPGECEIPFPVPPLTRVYRIYLPLVDPAAPGGNTEIAPPQGPTASVQFNALKAARAERAADVFGGIPLNVLETAKDPRWNEPALKVIEVRDPAAVIRTMAVQERGKAVGLEMGNEHVTELLDAGSTLAPRAGGGFVRLKLTADAKKPLVHQVGDLQGFLSNPSATLPGGRRRQLRLSQAALTKLAAGEPVVSGAGGGATVLMRIINDGLATDATDGREDSRSTSTSTNPPPPPGGTTAGQTGPPPPPSQSQPTTPPQLAVLLPLDQTWLLKTYERGRLVSSISLIPQEEVTIDIFSWDRRKTSREDTTSFDSEVNAESQSLDRDTRDVFSELSKTGNFGWGLNGSYSGYGISIGGNINNGATLSNISRSTLQNFHEETRKASAKVHSSRQLKITESTEEGRETRVTRKLRNSNLCHPVTFHYFELAARYAVTTGYVKQETVFVLLVDNPLARPDYDVDYVRTYESVIRRALLEPAVASGLDAARILWTLSHAAPVICNDCPCPEDLADSETTANFTQAVNAVKALALALSQLRTASFSWTTFFFSLVGPATPPPFHGALPVNLNLALRQALFMDAIDQAAPGLMSILATMCAPFLGTGAITPAQLVAFNNQFAALDLTGIDAALAPDADLQTRIKGLLEARIRTAYAGQAKATALAMIAANATGNLWIDTVVNTWNANTLTESSAAGAIANAIIGAMAQSPGFGATDSNGVKQLAQSAKAALATWTAAATKSDEEAAEARRNHQTTFATVFPAANVLAAQERFDALVRHLRANADYYANVMVTDMISRGQFPVPIDLLQFAGFVALQPMTVVRGRLAYAIDLSSSPQFAAAATLLQSVIDAIPDTTETDDVTLPTPGFVIEPKLSCCSACEDFVEESRRIELVLKAAQADQARWEASRREKRISQATPDLNPFEPIQPAIKVSVEQEPPPE